MMNEINEIIHELGESPICFNGTVLHLIAENTSTKGKKKTIQYTSVAEKLCFKFSKDCSIPSLINKVRILTDTYKNLIKHIQKHKHQINSLLKEEFVFPVSSTLTKENSPENGHFVETNNQDSIGLPKVLVTPVKTRSDCTKCPSAKKINFSLKQSLSVEKKNVFKLKLSSANVKKTLKVRETKQKVKRHENRITCLKQTIQKRDIQLSFLERKYRKCTKKIKELQKENSKYQVEVLKLNDRIKALKDQNETVKREITVKNSEMKVAERQIDLFQSLLENENKCIDSYSSRPTKEGKMYQFDIRRCIYQELVYDVPVKYCGVLLQDLVGILLNKKLENVPCPSTCAQMAYELGVLSSVMLVEFMLKQRHTCLSWDATTIDGAHINEVHVTADKQRCLTLDISHLPGGKSCDYVSHIVTALSEAAASYGRFKGIPHDGLLKQITSSISSTLTDRAAVNACVTRQLRDEFESHLVQLNCNVHPLDSVARTVKSSLADLDRLHGIQGNCFGSDGTATNLINAVSILRFKDGTGDPLGFKNFLRENDLAIGTFVRYVGNRIHVLFHLAGILVCHQTKLIPFIEKQCTAANLIRTSILKDMKNDKIMAQVWALGVFGKILSGPWMTRFYSSEMSNLDMGPLIQQCVSKVRRLIDTLESIRFHSEDTFGTQLDPEKDDVFSSLMSYESGEESLQEEALKSILKASLTVLERQLSDFLTGDFVRPSADILEKCESAPTHNMASERALGCLDKMWRRAPNATVGFLAGKVRSKLNKTLEWLDKKTKEEKEDLVRFVVSEAREERVRKFVEHKGLLGEISARRREVSLQRLKSKQTSMVREINKSFKEGSSNSLPCQANLKDRIQRYINNPDSVLGVLFIHTINDNDRFTRIIQTLPKAKLEVSFWGMDETESSAIDFTMPANQLFADAILGNVVFL